MILLGIVVVLVLLAVAYRIRCAWSPYGSRGRRRGFYWVRGWWRGDQAVARDDD